LELVVDAVPLESVCAMSPDDGTRPELWAGYAGALGPDLPLNPLHRQDFYEAARGRDLAFAVATGDERLYANLLLTVGFVRPT
jgi:L-fucose mutarotase